MCDSTSNRPDKPPSAGDLEGLGGTTKEVTIGEKYTGKLPALPDAVEKLTVNSEQNITFTSFPSGLHHLEFGSNFNSPLTVPLPPALHTLIFGRYFNQPVEHLLLPPTLHTLTFGDRFNQPIAHLKFSPSLTCLSADGRFNQPLAECSIPPSLTSLNVGGNDHNHPLDPLLIRLPSLAELKVGRDYSHPFNALPSSLKKLTIGTKQNISFSPLPSGLLRLEFGQRFNSPLTLPLLPALQALIFGDKFNRLVEHLVLPDTLHTLIFGKNFNQPVEHPHLPPTLHTLTFGDQFNQPIAQLKLPPPSPLSPLVMNSISPQKESTGLT